MSAARGSEEAGCADLDDAQAGRWPGSADFDDLVCGYRRELHVYCYRMLGAFDEAEDHVQEVFLRAWRCRDRFQGQASSPTWLYRVATNARLDTLRRDARRAVPAPAGPGPSVAAMPWVQPYPDSLLDELAAGQPGPEAVAVSRETMSLAFLAVIQLLPPCQRAVLVLRDVVSWPAAEVAELLGTSIPAVNSALQRARTTLRDQWPDGWLDWAPRAEPDAGHRRLLQRFIAAHKHEDPEALIDTAGPRRTTGHLPQVGEWNGQQEVGAALRGGMNSPASGGCCRSWPTGSQAQPGTSAVPARPHSSRSC